LRQVLPSELAGIQWVFRRAYRIFNYREANLQVSRSDIETPSQSHHLTDLRFTDLPLSAGLQKGIAETGFVQCTPIQSQTLPLALEGQDVAGQAQTGTGKTAAFLIALFHRLEHNPPLTTEPGPPAPRALIMAPTRELAVQVHTDATVLGKHLPFKLGLAFGGTDYDKQRAVLSAGVDVLIGTPGRLIDFYKQRVFGLRGVQVLVLDEADRMFDLGFIKDIRYVLRRLPEHHRRLNMLFSATLSHRVLELAYEHMNDPELVRIEPDKMTVDKVTQSIYFPAMEEKLPLLLTLLRDRDPHRTMIFVNTRREADRLRDALLHNGINAEALSGDVPQRKRLRMLKDFQAGELAVLIGTDVASRGLHVPGVSHVFNYDLPQDPEDYVHRIGRTARAGATGDAISFGCETYAISLPDIEAFIGRKIPVSTFDHNALVTALPNAPRSHRPHPGGGGQRRGKPPPRHRPRPARRP
jgi:ATP-dependent RNA helicase RhlB